MNRMMVDIETLSVRPNAYVASIGIVVFNVHGIVMSAQFSLNPREKHPEEHIDVDTVKFWMAQSRDAQEKLFGDYDVDVALQQINDAYKNLCCDEIWARGPQFDVNAIENLMRIRGFKPAWKYYEVRDLRTVLKKDDLVPFVGTKHVAEDDALHQVKNLLAHWNPQ